MTVPVAGIWLAALALTGLFWGGFRYWPTLISEFMNS
jgi:hypothetical protein